MRGGKYMFLTYLWRKGKNPNECNTNGDLLGHTAKRTKMSTDGFGQSPPQCVSLRKRGRLAAGRRKGFLRRESASVGPPQIPTPAVVTPWWSFPSKASLPGHPGNCKQDRGTLQRAHTAQNVLLPVHFLFVGGNKMAANVSSVKGNLCWYHGQGITSAYSYRMYHLQRIPSTTYSRNQKKRGEKKVLNRQLNLIYIFHSVFFLLWFFTKVHFDKPLKENPRYMSNRFKKRRKKKNVSNNPTYTMWKK